MIEWSAFARAVRVKLAVDDVKPNDAFKALGVSRATLHRLRKGKAVDAETMLSVSVWLQRDPREFLSVKSTKSSVDAESQISM